MNLDNVWCGCLGWRVGQIIQLVRRFQQVPRRFNDNESNCSFLICSSIIGACKVRVVQGESSKGTQAKVVVEFSINLSRFDIKSHVSLSTFID